MEILICYVYPDKPKILLMGHMQRLQKNVVSVQDLHYLLG